MLVALSDTHRDDGHGLEEHRLSTLREADVVCHAGDFTKADVYESFLGESERLEAVYGNVDEPAVRDHLPPTRTFAYRGARVVLVHGHEHSETGLSMLARQEGADVLISGHSHRPRAVVRDGRLFLNPGSHADPRGARAAHGELEVESGSRVRIEARLVDSDGKTFERATA